MTIDFFTVFYSRTQFDDVSYFTDAELSREHSDSPMDFYRNFSTHFPEKLRGEILEAIDKQWDFIIDVQGETLTQIRGHQDVNEVRGLLTAKEAERSILGKKDEPSFIKRVAEVWGYRK